MPDRISIEVRATHTLTAGMWDEIWQLTSGFYDVQREYAEAELRRRPSLAMLRADGALIGMASLDVYLGLRTFLRARLRFPLRPIYWFFDTFSYKSYLLLPRNFAEFWPRRGAPTPEAHAALIGELAARSYGAAWQPARGVVLRSGQKRLRATAAPVAPGVEADPDVAFFTGANPGHAEGDMLVCLCPLTLRNWLSVGQKAWQRTRLRPARWRYSTD